MVNFRIKLAPAASKDLDDLETETITKILSKIRIFEKNPFPKGKLIKKIKGKKTRFFRLRVDKFRVFYEIQHMKVVTLRVLSKKEAERFIKKF